MVIFRRFRRENRLPSRHPGGGRDPRQLRMAASALFVLYTTIVIPTAANPSGVPTMNDSAPNIAATTNDSVPQTTGLHDFDFFMGRWNVRGRRLRERLKGSHEWIELEATAVARPLLSGFGNEDEFHTDFWPGFVGMSFRFFDPRTRQWSIYWSDNVRGGMEPPVVGSFSGDVGIFEGPDTFEGRPILVRYTWSRVTTASPRWEQAFSEDGGKTWETNWVNDFTRPSGTEHGAAIRWLAEEPSRSRDFPVIELRRYTIKDGEREHFATYFDAYSPEAFQQIGAIMFGQFLERGNASTFTWLRGFRDTDARAAINAAFYYGPVWKEPKTTMNDRLVDHTNVLLLRPLAPETRLPVFPAVDAVHEVDTARGVVVAQIFAIKPGANNVETFAAAAAETFAGYCAAGARPLAVLSTLDVPNNFPQLPFRTDGPHLVWLGMVESNAILDARLSAVASRGAAALERTELLRGSPEWIVLDPTPRSRLRWLPD
jgi:hypothetical protein